MAGVRSSGGRRELAHLVQEHRRERRRRCVLYEISKVVFGLRSLEVQGKIGSAASWLAKKTSCEHCRRVGGVGCAIARCSNGRVGGDKGDVEIEGDMGTPREGR